MNRSVSQMSPPPLGTPSPGFVGPPPGYGQRPKKNTATVVLIVLAVVFGGGIFLTAILAAILFPVFAKVRDNARLTVCASNVERLELGLTMYLQDHGNKFPASPEAYKAFLLSVNTDAAEKNKKLFHCPSDVSDGDSYVLNTKLEGVSLSDVSNPRDVVGLYEGKNNVLEFHHQRDNQPVAVVGFVDGHVSFVKADQAKNLRWTP